LLAGGVGPPAQQNLELSVACVQVGRRLRSDDRFALDQFHAGDADRIAGDGVDQHVAAQQDVRSVVWSLDNHSGDARFANGRAAGGGGFLFLAIPAGQVTGGCDQAKQHEQEQGDPGGETRMITQGHRRLRSTQ